MHIFYCAGGKFREVAGVFLAEKHSSDAGRGGTRRIACASGVLSVTGPVRVRHRTHVKPCWCIRCYLSSIGVSV